MKIVFLLCLYNSKMKLVSGYGKICKFEGVEGVLLPCICNYVVSLYSADLSSLSLIMRESAFINVLCETAHPVQHEFSRLL